MHSSRSSERLAVRQLSEQLQSDIRRLTRGESLQFDRRVRSQIEDAAAEIGRNIEQALATDHAGECGRFLRLARSAVNSVKAGLQIARLKKYVVERDVRTAEELLSRLYPALSSLLATASSPSGTPGPLPSYTRPSATSSRT
jgi:four helix bundle protein